VRSLAEDVVPVGRRRHRAPAPHRHPATTRTDLDVEEALHGIPDARTKLEGAPSIHSAAHEVDSSPGDSDLRAPVRPGRENLGRGEHLLDGHRELLPGDRGAEAPALGQRQGIVPEDPGEESRAGRRPLRGAVGGVRRGSCGRMPCQGRSCSVRHTVRCGSDRAERITSRLLFFGSCSKRRYRQSASASSRRSCLPLRLHRQDGLSVGWVTRVTVVGATSVSAEVRDSRFRSAAQGFSTTW
jgi:hypothetical protein